MSNNLGIYLRYIIGIINYLGITLSEPIISHLYINILSHNWYYQLLDLSQPYWAYHLLQLHKWYYHLLRHSLTYTIGIINNLGIYFRNIVDGDTTSLT
jgi:hypothetical protein